MRVADLDVRPDRVMLDTNVLLAATDESRAEHGDALTILNEWAAGDTTLCTSGQILRKVADRLQNLLADVECKGKQVHDANVVATMLVHGVGTVVTMNVADFARFERYVSLVEL
jgi:predicted nucleic acid-binding protein